jgi:hypothetical protein
MYRRKTVDGNSVRELNSFIPSNLISKSDAGIHSSMSFKWHLVLRLVNAFTLLQIPIFLLLLSVMQVRSFIFSPIILQ